MEKVVKKHKKWQKVIGTVLVTTTAIATMPGSVGGVSTVAEAETSSDVSKTVKLLPGAASTFNDTNGDGLGEFQGFGTSLCWWANRVGYSDKLTQAAAEAFFGDDGLRMSIGRYNIGGGDNVGEMPTVSVNDKASFYDLSDESILSYAGSSMSIGSNTAFSSTTYAMSDADFGITSGTTVGSFDAIGWINALDAEVGSGGNLEYTVTADETAEYTLKMIFTLTGTNARGVSIRVAEDSSAVNNTLLSTMSSTSSSAASSSSSVVDDTDSTSSNSAASFLSKNETDFNNSSSNIASSGESDSTDDATALSGQSTDQSGEVNNSGSQSSLKSSAINTSSDQETDAEAGTSATTDSEETENTDDQAKVTLDSDIRLFAASEGTVYTVTSDVVNSNILASASNAKLYLVTFENVALTEGTNKITIGGAGSDWCLDFVKMAIIKSGDEGVLPTTSKYLHASHITRSDSVVPGYATDVTEIDLDSHDESYYAQNFDRYDVDCGFAWNYDWDADANQINVLKAAIEQAEASGTREFLAEAFSNSPPYFMTVSGCSSGNTNAGEDNLRADSYNAFAYYMADVIKHWEDNGIHFQSVTPMNEPYTSYWGAYSNKQEGCHFDIGDSESNIIVALNKALTEVGVTDIVFSASDETSIDTAIEAYNALSDDAKEVVTRIDTHTYSGSNRSGLKALAEESGENLWMSEVDGSGTAGTDAGEMAPALWLASYMMTDLNGLMPSAWILWDAVDIHADENNQYDTNTLDEVLNNFGITSGSGYWGIAVADHNNEELYLTRKYYAFGQLSRYILPGYTLIGSSSNTVAAYDPESGKVVVVAVNTSGEDETWRFNLSDFSTMGSDVTAIRTSGSNADGESWADVSAEDDIVINTNTKTFTATMKANSITTYIVEDVTYDSSEETIVSVEDVTVYAASGATAVLPDTVTAKTSKNNETEVAVNWDTTSVDLTSSCSVTGTVVGTDFEVTATVKIVEANIQYYIDCNDTVSKAYYSLDEFADLYNEVPDQKYDGETNLWGYVDNYGSGWANDGNDSWQSGWYAYSGQSIQYKVPIEAGDYVFTFGFKEWWSQSRPMKISVTLGSETTVLGTTNSKNGSNNWNTPSYEFTAAEDGELLITVSKAESNNPDPVLSFIKIQHVLELDELKEAMSKAQALDTSAFSASKQTYLQTLLTSAASLMIKAATTQDEVDDLTEELNAFISNGAQGYTEAELAENDYVLYLVDCASKDTSVVPDGYVMGLYQSVTDQVLQEDAETGYKWGHSENDTYTGYVAGGSSDDTLTGTYYYMDPAVTYLKNTSGFKYTFELPDRTNDDVEVTVGIKNPWSSRTVDIVIEGETVADGITCSQSTLVENTYTVSVSDNELEVFVHNPDRTSQYVDPVLSYIIVKAVPAYTIETLRAALATYAAAMDGHEYSDATMEVYEAAADAAQALIDENSKDSVAIEEAYNTLKDAYDNLLEVFKMTYTSITGTDGDVLYDNNGIKVQAHGGQIQQFTVDGVTKYYWYGEDKTNGYRPVVGVHLYTSTDLYNWTDEGVVLKSIPVSDEEYGTDQEDGYVADLSIFETDEYFKDLYSDYVGQSADNTSLYSSKLEEVYWNLAEDRCVIERPKVLYNDKTGKYVMWFHADGRTPASSADYGKASVGIAVSDSPVGPFKLLGTYKMLYSETADHSWDSSNLGSARDMNLFKDDDGSAYVIYSSDGNTNMYIAKLNDEYTGLAATQETAVLDEDFSINFVGASREAPAMFKYNGKYYMITSGCTGWAPNQAKYATADSPLGPWTMIGDPCTEDTKGTTYNTQSTCVFPVDAAAGKFIYMGDRWNSSDLGDSRYVWLPVEFLPGDQIALGDYSDWTLDELDNKGVFEIVTELPTVATSLDDLKEQLPDTVNVKDSAGSTSSMAVTWEDIDSTAVMGNVTITGTLDNGRSFTQEVNMIPEKMIYFFDCAGDGADYFTYARKTLGTQLINTEADQAYSADTKAGYTGTIKSDDSSSYDMGIKNAGDDIWSHGYWAGSSKTIDYSFDLEKGDYTVATGYQEWWSTSRPTKISVLVDGEEIANTTFTLSSSDTARLETVSFSLEEDAVVTISVKKTGSPDPVLSFIGVVEDSLVITEDPSSGNSSGSTSGSGSGTSSGSTSGSGSTSSGSSSGTSSGSTSSGTTSSGTTSGSTSTGTTTTTSGTTTTTSGSSQTTSGTAVTSNTQQTTGDGAAVAGANRDKSSNKQKADSSESTAATSGDDKETEIVEKTDTKDTVADGKEESSSEEAIASASTSTAQIDEPEVPTTDTPDDKNRRALIIATAAIIIAALGAIAGMTKLGLLNAIANIFKK